MTGAAVDKFIKFADQETFLAPSRPIRSFSDSATSDRTIIVRATGRASIYGSTIRLLNSEPKKRKTKWAISYSKVTIPEAGKRLGKGMSIARMLANEKYPTVLMERDAILKTKTNFLISKAILRRRMRTLGTMLASDLVYAIISPILFDFRSRTGRKARGTFREGEIDCFCRL